MRRALRLLLIAALVAAIVASATGWHALELLRRAGSETEALDVLDATALLVHALAGHLTAALAGLVASMAFVLGLQGLLDATGRRTLSGALFVLAPTIAWLALGAEFSGGVDTELVHSGLLSAELERVSRDHALVNGCGLVLALLGTAVVSWFLSRDPLHERAG